MRIRRAAIVCPDHRPLCDFLGRPCQPSKRFLSKSYKAIRGLGTGLRLQPCEHSHRVLLDARNSDRCKCPFGLWMPSHQLEMRTPRIRRRRVRSAMVECPSDVNCGFPCGSFSHAAQRNDEQVGPQPLSAVSQSHREVHSGHRPKEGAQSSSRSVVGSRCPGTDPCRCGGGRAEGGSPPAIGLEQGQSDSGGATSGIDDRVGDQLHPRP